MKKIIDKKWKQIDHDLKRLAKGIRILRQEDDKDKKELIGGLLFDEAERLREDLEELRENNKKEE